MLPTDLQTRFGYVAYVDEAGDFGLRRVAPIDHRGASEWLILSGVVVRTANEPNLPRWLRRIRIDAKNTQAPDLHYRTLSDRQKKIICEKVAGLDARLFAVISNKQNMRRHRNEKAASVSNTRAYLYWWMCRLLIERMTEFCERRNQIEGTPGLHLRIELSRRKDLRYTELTNYLSRLWIQTQSDSHFIKKKMIRWSVFKPTDIEVYDHRSRAGLQIADVVASSFYQSMNRVDVTECKPGPAKSLKPRMWRGPNGQIFDNGFKVFPFPLKYPNLNDAQKEVFRHYGYPEHQW